MGANAFLHCILIQKVCLKLHFGRIEIKGKFFPPPLAKTFAKSHFSCRATGKQHFWDLPRLKKGRTGWLVLHNNNSRFFFGRPYVVGPSVTMPKIWTNAPGHIIHHPIVAPYQRLPPPTTEKPLKKRTIYDLRFPKLKTRSVATLFRPLFFFVMGNWGCLAPGRKGSQHSTYS